MLLYQHLWHQIQDKENINLPKELQKLSILLISVLMINQMYLHWLWSNSAYLIDSNLWENLQGKVVVFYHQPLVLQFGSFGMSIALKAQNTTQLAKLRVTDQNKIQTNLDFSPSVRIVKPRNKQFYQSIWKIAEKPYKVLYQKLLISNPNFSLSWGSFLALRPFYICHSTLQDMEMCCCLLHLHAKWSINAIIQCAKKQNIPLEPFDSYTTFFKALTEQCSNHDYTYIFWQCTWDKKTTCQDISSSWECLKLFLVESSNGDATLPFNYFQKTNIITKKGKETKHLKLLKTDAGMVFLVNFVDNILAN